jgi:TP901 family phage tail tape measure protein
MARTEKEMHAKITADDRDFKQKTDSVKKQGKSLGNTMSRIGKQIAGAFAAAFAFTSIIRGFKSMITTTAEFEKSLASLSAITGATGDELGFYGDTARDLARKTTLSAAEIVEAFKLMGSARPELLKNKEALAAVTKEAIVLAEASGMQVVDATNALAKAMNQFNIPAAEAGRAINVLAAGSKFGAAEIPAVAEAIKSMGTAANMANISLEESVAMIETLAEKGLSGAQSGTMLRNVILRLQTGIDDFNPKVVGVSQALENLAAANLDSAELTKMFGLESQQAAAILIELRKRFNDLTESVTGTNTAYEQQAVMTDTLQDKWTMFKDTLGDLTIRGDKFTTSLKGILSSATELMQVMQDTASSKTLKWWEKIALQFNQVIPGGLKLTRKELDALEKGRDKSLKSLGDLIDLEEKLISIKDIGNKKGKEAAKSYQQAVEAVSQPMHEQLQILEKTDEEILKLSDSLTNIDESYMVVGKNIKELVYQLTYAEQAAILFGEALMDAAVAGEMGIKDYGREVLNVIRKTIKAYIAEGVAKAASQALGSLPFPFNIAAASVAAGAAAALFNTLIPAFADGGAVQVLHLHL